MEDAYGLDNCQVLMDLSDLDDCIFSICQIGEVGYDVTLFLNGLLLLISNKYMMDETLDYFLLTEIKKISEEYEEIGSSLRLNKIKRLSKIINEVRELGFALSSKFTDYDLYNKSGNLKISSINAQNLRSTLAVVKSKKWTKPSNQLPTFSISETPLQYLQRILLSH